MQETCERQMHVEAGLLVKKQEVTDRKNNVLSLAGGSWDFDKVKTAMLTLYPKDLPKIEVSGKVLMNEEDRCFTQTEWDNCLPAAPCGCRR